MKNLNFIDKILFIANSIVAFVLLLAYFLPLMPPKNFAILSVLSLGLPLLMLLNVLFFVYWLVKIKRQMILSLVVVAFGVFLFGSLYKFSNSDKKPSSKSLSVMNYNVRLFDLYDWIPEEGTQKKIEAFIKKEQPDVLCIQEYHPTKEVDLSSYKYKYESIKGNKIKYGQAIFSKFPIVNSGSVEFPETANNAIFADVVVKKDTIRVYNIHLQSLKIDKKVEDLTTSESEEVFMGVGKTFKMQQFQSELFLLHKAQCKYKTIISGDFNNTAFSYVYRSIKGEMKDTFKQSGNGFGRTFNFKFFPLRIDFILVDEAFTVNNYRTYDVQLSDHYPIKTSLSF
ncbi:endonuclease/exonuclease/phosphatase family protein [Aurantibacter aestuarii]|uniref:Endonuclease n=1 Tax=Aurantibacter aestuarii TaxID=1266046 RepID=A0A2T1N529_9FLAO|nr:endonuclease/exonuclease/phosphatase family protein [Aurantibacter aestuarii]PSG86397.1 endonuclease [Aurantibacter aestuarii]